MSTSGELTYLKDVLGIKSFLLPCDLAQGPGGSESQSLSPEGISHVSLSVSGEGRKNAVFLRQKNAHSFFCGEFSELTQKILSGVKLSINDVWLIEAEHNVVDINDLLAQLPRKPQNLQILVMGELQLSLGTVTNIQTLTSYDPARILSEPEIKREFWEQLKLFLVKLQN